MNGLQRTCWAMIAVGALAWPQTARHSAAQTPEVKGISAAAGVTKAVGCNEPLRMPPVISSQNGKADKLEIDLHLGYRLGWFKVGEYDKSKEKDGFRYIAGGRYNYFDGGIYREVRLANYYAADAAGKLYDSRLIGPTIRVDANDEVIITLVNRLPLNGAELIYDRERLQAAEIEQLNNRQVPKRLVDALDAVLNLQREKFQNLRIIPDGYRVVVARKSMEWIVEWANDAVNRPYDKVQIIRGETLDHTDPMDCVFYGVNRRIPDVAFVGERADMSRADADELSSNKLPAKIQSLLKETEVARNYGEGRLLPFDPRDGAPTITLLPSGTQWEVEWKDIPDEYRLYTKLLITREPRIGDGYSYYKIFGVQNVEDGGHADPNMPHDFNRTNLHLHGVEVSPQQDDVLRTVLPSFSSLYHFTLKDHVSGTFWYHPHIHGSTALQVGSGASGFLLIGGGKIDTDVPAIKAASEKLLLFNEMIYNPDQPIWIKGPNGQLEQRFVGLAQGYKGLLDDIDAHPPNGVTINGQIKPIIEMRPGEVQRWRMLHSGYHSALAFDLVDQLVPLAGRYVRVEIPGNDKILSLSEVQVFKGRDNVALNRPAKQSSVDWNGVASRAVDGNTNGDFASGNTTTHTLDRRNGKPAESNPWWEVDLGQATNVDSIVVWGRTDDPASKWRLTNYRVSILDANRKTIWSKDVATPPDDRTGQTLTPANRTQFCQFAMDGINFKNARMVDGVYMAPGNRTDALVKAPDKPGTYYLRVLEYQGVAEYFPDTPAKPQQVNPGEEYPYLAKIVVSGAPVSMALLDPKTDLPEHQHGFAKLDETKAVGKRQTIFDISPPPGLPPSAGMQFKVNGAPFNPVEIAEEPVAGTIEEWIAGSDFNIHPFHIHINPFQVTEYWVWEGTLDDPRTRDVDERKGSYRKMTVSPPMWKDTAMVMGPMFGPLSNRDERVRMLTKYNPELTGDFVMHCHVLYHEDKGMMQRIRVISPREAAKRAVPAAIPSPSDKPAAALPKGGTTTTSLNLKGQPTLLVFNKGLGCPHCAEQVQKLAARHKEFADLRVGLAAISPEEITAESAAVYRDQYKVTFPVLADPQLDLFRQYGVGDQPRHALIFVDSNGQPHTVSRVDRAETDIDVILGKLREIAGDNDSQPATPLRSVVAVPHAR